MFKVILALLVMPVIAVAALLSILYISVNAPIWIGFIDWSGWYLIACILIFFVGVGTCVASSVLFVSAYDSQQKNNF